jgi:predicted DNA-binding protein YlxM (UPF0122 family)
MISEDKKFQLMEEAIENIAEALDISQKAAFDCLKYGLHEFEAYIVEQNKLLFDDLEHNPIW